MNQSNSGQIDSVMQEDRLFPPSAEFAAKAKIKEVTEESIGTQVKEMKDLFETKDKKLTE